MQRTLVWESLTSLSNRDRVFFLRFIKSPYFNQRTDLIHLAEILLSEEVRKLEVISKEKVFQLLFTKKTAYNDQKLRLLTSYLQKQIELFMAVEEFQGDNDEVAWLMLSGMQKRNVPRTRKRKLKHFKSKVSDGQDSKFHLGQYRLELQALEQAGDASKDKMISSDLLVSSLDNYYLSSRLKHICSAISYHSVFDKYYVHPDVDWLMQVANQKKFLKNPTISIYIYFIKVMSGKEDFFVKIKETLFLHQKAFSKQEFYEIYKMILNFYIRKINEKNISYTHETLEFYKKGLELDLLFNEGFLSRFTYSNIVACAIREREIEWVGNFIEMYKLALRKSDQKQIYSLNKARLAFALQEYDVALETIKNVKFKELLLIVAARMLQIKIYWESGEFDRLASHLHSLSVFMTRKKVIGYHQKVVSNVIGYTKKLSEVNPFDVEAVAKLKVEIEAEEDLMEKDWLLVQLDNL